MLRRESFLPGSSVASSPATRLLSASAPMLCSLTCLLHSSDIQSLCSKQQCLPSSSSPGTGSTPRLGTLQDSCQAVSPTVKARDMPSTPPLLIAIIQPALASSPRLQQTVGVSSAIFLRRQDKFPHASYSSTSLL